MPNIDLTTLPGWSSLSTGSHNITIVAKADGYRDSEPSAGVTVTKAATLPKPSDLTGTKWKFNNTITFPSSSISVERLYGTVSYTGQNPTSFDSEQTYFYSCFVGTSKKPSHLSFLHALR